VLAELGEQRLAGHVHVGAHLEDHRMDAFGLERDIAAAITVGEELTPGAL
jgi:hypothetical protein